MKKLFIIVLFLTVYLNGFAPAAAGENSFADREVPVVRNVGMDGSTARLRFYDDMPNVAYISAADYLKLWTPEAEMRVEMVSEGVFELTSPTGKAVADTLKNTFSSEDMSAFTNLMGLVQDGMPNSYYDGMPFVRFVRLESEPAVVPVSFDFEPYHIDLRSDGNEVYFPFAVISDIYSDLFYHHSGFNGEKIVMNYSNFDMTLNVIDPSYFAGLVSQTRPEDLALFTYHELCFALDHFYGRPGREPIHAAMALKGLDEALDDFGETGAMIKRYLKSTNTAEFYTGMEGLYALFYDGGHTYMQPGYLTGVLTRDEAGEIYDQYAELMGTVSDMYGSISHEKEIVEDENADLIGLQQIRNNAYGTGTTYIKKGDTAVCVFNTFNARNQEAWDAYYAGTGPFPTLENTDNDAMVIFLDALYRAQEDPEVRNLVIDISANMGGSADLVMAMVSLITGKSELHYENVLTGQKNTAVFETDRNFDGVFDKRDAEVRFDLNFAVLTSRHSFSCGNLFPSILHDAGYPILGEQSGGGACAVSFLNTADGYDFLISSGRARLLNEEGEIIDSGIPVDAELADHGKRIEILVPGFDQHRNYVMKPYVMDDYRPFYDIDVLSQMVNELYTVPAEMVGVQTGAE